MPAGVETIEVRQLRSGVTEVPKVKEWKGKEAVEISKESVPSARQIKGKVGSGQFKIVKDISALTDRVIVQSLLDDRIRLRYPVTLTIEQEGMFYVAKPVGLLPLDFGYAEDPLGAVDDLRQTLAELYWLLKQEKQHGELAPALAEDWKELSSIISEQ